MAKDLPVSVRVASDLIERLDAIAKRWDRSRSYVIGKAIERLVEFEERSQREIAEGFSELDHGHSIPWDSGVEVDLRRLAEHLDGMDERDRKRGRGDEAAE